MEPIFKKFAIEVFQILMGRPQTCKTDAMTWVDMKNYKTKCAVKIEAMELYINSTALELRRLAQEKESSRYSSSKNLTTACTTKVSAGFSAEVSRLTSVASEFPMVSDKLMSKSKATPSTISSLLTSASTVHAASNKAV